MKEETPAPPSSTDSPTQSLLPSETQQIEIPFVPASQRLAAAAIVDDSIVVVGQTKRNKRKRGKASSTTQDADRPGLPEDDIEGSLTKTELPEAPPSQPFDFSTVSNILDVPQVDGSDSRQLKKKRQKRDKGDWLPIVQSSGPSTNFSYTCGFRRCFGVWSLSCASKSTPRGEEGESVAHIQVVARCCLKYDSRSTCCHKRASNTNMRLAHHLP
jgi:hypothetical protein